MSLIDETRASAQLLYSAVSFVSSRGRHHHCHRLPRSLAGLSLLVHQKPRTNMLEILSAIAFFVALIGTAVLVFIAVFTVRRELLSRRRPTLTHSALVSVARSLAAMHMRTHTGDLARRD